MTRQSRAKVVCLAGACLWTAATLFVTGRSVVATNGESASTQEVTIPRVGNPPLTSDLVNLPGDLRTVAVPGPSNLSEFVRDFQMARALGKALVLGHAGWQRRRAGVCELPFPRRRRPAVKKSAQPWSSRMPGCRSDLHDRARPQSQLQAPDFPLTRLANPAVRGALDPLSDSDDAVSSQGVHHLGDGIDPQGFQSATVNTRRVEPRNTPSVINAVFNHRQFWDGRAENMFNGVNHLGQRDPNAKVFRADDPANPVEVRVELVNSSLASQAVAPIVSTLEMSEPGRTVQDVGSDLARTPRKIYKRIRKVRPLAKQQVHPADSVLGPLSRWPNPGLTARNYDEMIKVAFHERWWRSNRLIQVNADGSKRAGRIGRTMTPRPRSTRLSSTISRSSSASRCSSTRRRSSPTIRRGIASVAKIQLRPIRT